jgi:hypothetical protein
MGKTFKIVGDDISDGYHTFDELYIHRCLLFINLCLTQPEMARWKPEPSFGEWFCLYWESPKGQISYHIPNKYLPWVEANIQRDDDHKFDGHTSDDVIQRLCKLAARKSLAKGTGEG